MIRTTVESFFLFIIAGFLTSPTAMAQFAPAETFYYEVAGSWLGLTPAGNVQTNSNRVDFRSDLGIDGTQSQVGFWFLAKPWERNGLFVEFIPYRFDGELTISRSFRFGGVTYPTNQPVTAKATMNYVSLGYHRDIVNRLHTHASLLAGVTYFAVRSHASSPAVGTAEVDRDLAFPLIGLSTIYSPTLASKFIFLGDLRGMTFGAYGNYLDVAGALGWNLSPHVALEGGYRVVDGKGHHRTRGGDLNFHGPTITLRLHDR
jgi:hypothetical protein